MSPWTNGVPSIIWLAAFEQQEGWFSLEHQGVCNRNPLLNLNLNHPPPGLRVHHQNQCHLHLPRYCALLKILPIIF